MSESKMVVGGMQLKRVDLLGIRRRIGAALGQEKLRKYWEILKRYTQFLISKFELDVHAAAVLGAENVPLHNELIRGIFQNALVGTIDPSADAPPTLGLDELDPRPAKKPKRRVGPSGNIIVAGGAPGNKAAQQWKEAAATQRLTHDQIWLDAHERHRTQWNICNGADLYDESWELPSVVGLRQKMRKRCQEHSLTLAQEAVEGLHKTMEEYVVNIIAACLQVAKLRRGSDEPPKPGRASIHPQDLVVAMALQPELLGQRASVQRERLGLLQH
mmetsp:Transcript_559/g.1260  ORF Transcript_559/g.1260 Transcript_559/m.1260 type:complete len:273 (+) Transcript_559:171-989(+)